MKLNAKKLSTISLIFLLCLSIFIGLEGLAPLVSAQSGITRVQYDRGTATSGTTVTTTMGSTPVSGNLLIAAISADPYYSTESVASVSETGAAWSKVVGYDGGSGGTLVEIWKGNVSSGASTTITTTFGYALSAAVVNVCEYSGLSGIVDQNNSAVGTGSPSSTGTITTTQASELIIGAITVFPGTYNQTTPQNGFILLDGSIVNLGNQVTGAYLENIVSSTGTYSTGTSAVSISNYDGCIASFEAGASVSTSIITASSDSESVISPSGSVVVDNGDSQTFTISAQPNYSIYQVIVDGVNEGSLSSYTFTDVTSSHNISVLSVTNTIAPGVIQNGIVSTAAYTLTSLGIRFQQKSFFASSRYWIFYMDVNSSGYQFPYFTSSVNGINWLAPTLLSVASVMNPGMPEHTGENLQVLYNNGYVDVFIRGDFYKRGTPNSDGTVTWLTDWQQITNNISFDFYAAMDSTGHLWFTSVSGDISGHTDFVYKNEDTNGSWVSDPSIPVSVIANSTVDNDFMVPLPSGQIYFFFFDAFINGTAIIYGRLWNGSQFGQIQNVSADDMFDDTSQYGIQAYESYARSAVVDSNGNIYLAFLNTALSLVSYKYSYVSGTWGSEQTVQTGCIDATSPSLILYNNVLQVTWINSSTTIDESTYNGSSWSAPSILVNMNSNNPIPLYNEGTEGWNGRLNAFNQVLGADIGLIWETNNTANTGFQINFGLVQLSSTILYSNIAVSSTLANNPTVFSSYWSDNVEPLNSFIFSTNNTGSWVNDTATAFSATPSWANVTETLTSSIGQIVGYQWYVNDSQNNWVNTGIQTLTTTGYYITAQSDAFSNLSPNGLVAVDAGSNQAFSFSPINGSYSIRNVIINSTYQAPTTSPYTFLNVQGNESIAVSTSNIIFSVTATSDDGCVINPTGNVLVPYGFTASFTMVAYPNYEIYNLEVNNTAYGPVSGFGFIPTGNGTTLYLTSISTITPTPPPSIPANPTPTPTEQPIPTIQPLTSSQDELYFTISIIIALALTAVSIVGYKRHWSL